MKTRLNITIESDLLKLAKRFAAQKKVSLSQLIEDYLYSVTKSVQKGNIIQVINNLPVHTLDLNKDLKQAYYEGKKSGHGV